MAAYLDFFKPSSYTLGQISAISAVCFFIYVVSLASYRLYFSPLAKYPGRKLAALTLWYEFYHDYIRRGQYQWELEDMHAKYGPIVRISPRELHIDDPDFYDQLFGSALKLDKDPYVVGQFGQALSTQATESASLHRIRRAALSPFFSSAKVSQLQGGITNKIEKLCGILTQHQASQIPANMHNLYRALTVEIITEYAFAESWNSLDHLADATKWFDTIMRSSEASAFIRQFNWVMKLMLKFPPWLVVKLVPDLKASVQISGTLGSAIQRVQDAGPDISDDKNQTTTIFHELIFRSSLPEKELTKERLIAEGNLVVIAGSETTGNTLAALHFHLLANPDKLAILRAELANAMPDPWSVPELAKLKQLPYLSACIDESLRIAGSVTHRLARMAPKGGLKWRDRVIPEGTAISMSSFLTQMRPDIFPQPKEFIPERWLGPDAKGLKKYFAPLSKGPRICLGLELAYAEMYLATAMIHRRYTTNLYQTTRSDIDPVHDFFQGYHRLDSPGLRITVS